MLRAVETADSRRIAARYVSNAGIGLMAIGIVLPLLRPHLLIAWMIAIGLAVAGVLCLAASQSLLR